MLAFTYEMLKDRLNNVDEVLKDVGDDPETKFKLIPTIDMLEVRVHSSSTSSFSCLPSPPRLTPLSAPTATSRSPLPAPLNPNVSSAAIAITPIISLVLAIP